MERVTGSMEESSSLGCIVVHSGTAAVPVVVSQGAAPARSWPPGSPADHWNDQADLCHFRMSGRLGQYSSIYQNASQDAFGREMSSFGVKCSSPARCIFLRGKDASQRKADQTMLFVIPHQRTVQRSTHKRMSRADLYCFLLVLLVLLGIIADKVATHGIPAH